MNDDDARPDPDLLLAQVSRDEARAKRGKLKVFLGFAAGVGKTYAMLRAAKRLHDAGTDVVVGYVEAHGRPETDALLEGLPVVARRSMKHGGIALEEMDLDAILKRHPQLALVDELAHTNATGSRHAKRWQDVEELLDAGIDVFTTLNVQHLESLNDVVAQITGVVVRETLPDRVLDEANDIELIDLPILELLERLGAGKIYGKEQASRAATGFFREGNLSALRELALRRAADRVDEQVRGYMRTHAIEGPWAARERVLVCVSPSPLSERLVRSTKRLAGSIHAEWHAVHVETPDSGRLRDADRDRIAATLRLAEELGGRARTIHGEDVAKALVDYAREQNVTKIVVGKPLRSRWRELLQGAVVDRVVRGSGEIDVYVINSEGAASPPARARDEAPEPGILLRDLLPGLAMVAIVTIAGIFLRDYFAPVNLLMGYLVVVVLVSLRAQRRSAILIALASVLAFDFFLVPPYLTFAVDDAQYVVTFIAFMIVALITSRLASASRAQSLAAMRREAHTAALYECNRALAAAADLDDVVRTIVEQVESTFHENVAVWLANDRSVELHAKSAPFPTQVFEKAVAQWVFDHAQPAGKGTETLTGVRSLLVPMLSGDRAYGAISLFRPDGALALEEQRLLQSFAGQAASAIERFRLAETAAHAQSLRERERVQTALLDSVSHDLRTPLASITGALTSLRDDFELLDEKSRRQLVETAAGNATRLNRLLGNLLDMSRLQAGALELKRSSCDLQDLVGSALEQLATELHDRRVVVDVANELPFVELDFVLMCQALVNVVVNAHKYSPPEASIEIAVRTVADSIVIEVGDRGIGIPASELERVFDKFHRVERSNAAQGTGLGLSISRAIVAAHGGTIAARNREGGGTLVSITIPRRGSARP